MGRSISIKTLLFELLYCGKQDQDTSSAQGIDSKGKGKFSLTFSMDSEGFMQLWKAIAEHSKALSEVSAAVESTACYHINLYSFLTAKGISTVVINPLLIANFAKLSLRKTKTDKKDAMSIAQFLLVHRESISQLSLSQDMQDFRDIARERESVGSSLPLLGLIPQCISQASSKDRAGYQNGAIDISGV